MRAFSLNLARRVLMVRPTEFGHSEETSKDNFFMNESSLTRHDQTIIAQNEFDAYVKRLKDEGVEVESFDQPDPKCVDAVFPNNWFSTHSHPELFPEGLLVTYPMRWPLRQLERKSKAFEFLKTRYRHHVDLAEEFERKELSLEGTGALIFDLPARKIFCALSERADERVLAQLEKVLEQHSGKKWSSVTFGMVDEEGRPFYHTNVGLAICERFAIVALENISNVFEREKVRKELEEHRKLIRITPRQTTEFAGNALELKGSGAKNILVMSERGFLALENETKELMKQEWSLVLPNLQLIEHVGGGSARCMVAELF